MDWTDIIKLIACILICEGAGGIGALFTTPAIPQWYRGLKKPGFTPPNRAFGPVWTALYLLMGISVFLVWKEGLSRDGVTAAFSLFWVQLLFNILWSAVFFGRRSVSGGLALITVLWLLILSTIVLSFRVSAAAGGLLVPYIIWVSIAANLNFQIWRLNR
ncbi:MAG: tryptophan-rich sensory protein [Dehalococcoidales bacterium]|nr:tryptophan-rich sensory protein [Dehalococcoidales bacterium]